WQSTWLLQLNLAHKPLPQRELLLLSFLLTGFWHHLQIILKWFPIAPPDFYAAFQLLAVFFPKLRVSRPVQSDFFPAVHLTFYSLIIPETPEIPYLSHAFPLRTFSFLFRESPFRVQILIQETSPLLGEFYLF